MKRRSGSPSRLLRQRACGFTLLEVLTAMTVLAIALGAAIKAVGDGARNTAHIEEQTLAHWLALNKIAEQRLSAAVPSVGTQSGSTQFAGQDWHWTTMLSATPDAATRRLQIEIRRPPGEGRPVITRIAFLPVVK
ncbi:MAG: type II secretion system minor pseudopilin GspI [Gammaproteobacteria bacterium]